MTIRLLHTADWHVGKALRGRSRQGEHEDVLAELVTVADARAVHLVVVAGDLFDVGTPPPEAERAVYRALLALAGQDRQVVIVAGNHDNPRRLAALRPLLALGRIHVATEILPAAAGGVLRLELGGQRANIVILPWLSQRYVVHGADLMSRDAGEHNQAYQARFGQIVRALCAGLDAGEVNLAIGHLHALGGASGGGERAAHTVMDYAVPATVFPAVLQYVALGHLHRRQKIDAAVPVHYPGSPLQLDFGETQVGHTALIAELTPGAPARVEEVGLEAGRRLSTVRGTLAELAQRRGENDNWLRVIVEEPRRAGLAEEVRELFGDRVVDVQLAPLEPATDIAAPTRLGRSPQDLFADYLVGRGLADPRLEALFAELLESANGPGRDHSNET